MHFSVALKPTEAAELRAEGHMDMATDCILRDWVLALSTAAMEAVMSGWSTCRGGSGRRGAVNWLATFTSLQPFFNPSIMNQVLRLLAPAAGIWPRRVLLVVVGMGLGPVAFGQAPTFVLQTPTFSTGGTSPFGVVVADVNGDGKLDALIANKSTSTLGVLLGAGNGSFALQPNSPSVGSGTNPYGLAVADVNGDGKTDVLLANETTNTLGVLLGDGRGGFAPQANSPSTGAGSRPRSVAVADVNGDG